MLDSSLEPFLLVAAQKYPIVTVIGPRQSGKTTLVKKAFPEYRYISFEDPEIRRLALEDARSFLQRYSERVIFDEVQRVPDILSYLQTIVDRPGSESKFVLTGSQNLLLDSLIT